MYFWMSQETLTCAQSPQMPCSLVAVPLFSSSRPLPTSRPCICLALICPLLLQKHPTGTTMHTLDAVELPKCQVGAKFCAQSCLSLGWSLQPPPTHSTPLPRLSFQKLPLESRSLLLSKTSVAFPKPTL